MCSETGNGNFTLVVMYNCVLGGGKNHVIDEWK